MHQGFPLDSHAAPLLGAEDVSLTELLFKLVSQLATHMDPGTPRPITSVRGNVASRDREVGLGEGAVEDEPSTAGSCSTLFALLPCLSRYGEPSEVGLDERPDIVRPCVGESRGDHALYGVDLGRVEEIKSER